MFFNYLFSIILCQLVGIFGALLNAQAITSWYLLERKPFFSPPNWVFAPVWTLLYLLMGIALARILQKGIKNKKVEEAVSWFGIQLALNFCWSIIFFNLQRPAYAFIEIIILWVAILITMLKFYKLDKLATWLLLPYLLWVAFAAILNLAVAILN